MKTHARSGYILVLTLMLLSVMVLLVFQIARQATVHRDYDALMAKREQAKQLAYGGLSLAMDQLTVEIKSTETTKKESLDDELKALVQNVVPILNRWQEYTLQEGADGIDATIKICISSENGKININNLYDFKKHAFKPMAAPEAKKIPMQLILEEIQRIMGGKGLYEELEKFLKKRPHQLDDVSELLLIDEFQRLFKTALFYEPTIQEKKEAPLRLFDIFTVWTNHSTLNPWLLSDSLLALYGLKRPTVGEETVQRKKSAEILKNVELRGTISKIWDDYLQKLYDKEFKNIPKELAVLLNPQFEAHVFSVLSYASIGNVSMRMYAILERRANQEFMIKKLYWI